MSRGAHRFECESFGSEMHLHRLEAYTNESLLLSDVWGGQAGFSSRGASLRDL